MVASGVAVVAEARRRRTRAAELLTKATQFAAQNDKYATEISGLKNTFAQMRARADGLREKLTCAKSFFDRYIIPCEEFLSAEKNRQELTDNDWTKVQYLARARIVLTDIARQPLI
jgi:hypothetical protein